MSQFSWHCVNVGSRQLAIETKVYRLQDEARLWSTRLHRVIARKRLFSAKYPDVVRLVKSATQFVRRKFDNVYCPNVDVSNCWSGWRADCVWNGSRVWIARRRQPVRNAWGRRATFYERSLHKPAACSRVPAMTSLYRVAKVLANFCWTRNFFSPETGRWSVNNTNTRETKLN